MSSHLELNLTSIAGHVTKLRADRHQSVSRSTTTCAVEFQYIRTTVRLWTVESGKRYYFCPRAGRVVRRILCPTLRGITSSVTIKVAAVEGIERNTRGLEKYTFTKSSAYSICTAIRLYINFIIASSS